MLTLALLGETQVPLTELFGDSVVLTIRLFFVFLFNYGRIVGIIVTKKCYSCWSYYGTTNHFLYTSLCYTRLIDPQIADCNILNPWKENF